MRHLSDHRKLGRTTPHRQALLRNLAVALILNERIRTTLPKAKELRRVADRLVTWGKKGTVAARREVRRWVNNPQALTKVFSDLAPRFGGRAGGYTRILRISNRNGDQAPMALIEYLPSMTEEATGPTKKSGATKGEKKKEAKTAAPAAATKKGPAKKAKSTKTAQANKSKA